MPDLSSQVKRPYLRRQYLVDRQFQLRFSLLFLALVLFLGLLVGLLTYFPAISLIQKQLYSPHISIDGSGELLVGLLCWINAGFALVLLFIVLFLVARHLRRTAASLDRLAGQLKLLAAGRIPAVIHFRRRDPLHAAAGEFNRMVNGLRDRQQRLDAHVQAAVHLLASLEYSEGGQTLPADGKGVQLMKNAARELEKALETLPAE